jgi:hypothetical protein
MPGLLDAMDSERAWFGLALRDLRVVAGVPLDVATLDRAGPGHDVLLEALAALAELGEDAGPIEVVAELNRRGTIGRLGVGDVRGALYVHRLVERAPLVGSAAFYRARVREAAARRALVAEAARITQAASESGDLDDALNTVAEIAARLWDLAEHDDDDAKPIDGLYAVEDFVRKEFADQEWIVPDLLERGDVFMLLAGEGSGKSVLARQMCLTIAAGVHPFEHDQRITPRRTMLIDLENNPSTVARMMKATTLQAEGIGMQPGMMHVFMHEEGFNLRKPADQILLDRAITEHKPDFIAIGPLYKMFQAGGDKDEHAAEDVRVVLDRMRKKHRVAFWIEGHMPKGDGTNRPKTPIGSSMWMRWAGYGRVLQRIGDNAWELVGFRGDRDQREIPAGLRRGGHWPWFPMDEIEVELARKEAGL